MILQCYKNKNKNKRPNLSNNYPIHEQFKAIDKAIITSKFPHAHPAIKYHPSPIATINSFIDGKPFLPLSLTKKNIYKKKVSWPQQVNYQSKPRLD